MEYSALIVAAGSGTRMGLGYNKVYAPMADGTLILEKTVNVFMADPDCAQIVVVTDPLEFRHHFTNRFPGKIVLCKGGKTRQESVCNGLRAVMCDIFFVHDGARPFVSQKNLNDLKQAMEKEDGAILAVPCKDTIKRVENGYAAETYDRSTLVNVQTPQCFKTSLLIDCLEKAVMDGFTGTDDASLVEKYSDTKVRIVEGSYENIKITTPSDLK